MIHVTQSHRQALRLPSRCQSALIVRRVASHNRLHEKHPPGSMNLRPPARQLRPQLVQLVALLSAGGVLPVR